ncbi:hypothetical protein [Streptomyces sp. 8N616]|uniref:hypothetical protein n=1 Tax=Streptomyces sp. 8N616 TaxID=3457414 RepID=UPI003FD41AA8
MTTSVELPGFASRQEGDGFVLHVHGTSRYLYANASAHEALSALRSGSPAHEVASAVATRYPSAADRADRLLAELVEVVAGQRERAGAADGAVPRICPLTDLIGDSADRCETFGMPL